MSLFLCIFLIVVRAWFCMHSDMFELSAGWTWRKRVIIPFTKNSIRYREKSRLIIYTHIYIRRTYANFWQNIICLRSPSCLIRLHRVVYYFYAWRIWMVLELEGIGRRSHGKSEAAEKKRHFFTAMRGKNVEPFFDNSLIRKGPLTYNQRTCRTIRGSCHCPCLCRCRPLSTSAS